MTPMDVLIVVERFFLYWLAYSFAGWVWETGLSVVLRKRFEAVSYTHLTLPTT